MNNILLKRDLTAEQLSMVQSEFEGKKKSKGVAFLLWVFTGGIGGHRFYLGDIGYAVGMLFLNWATLGIWSLIDVFLISKRLEVKNTEKEREIIETVKIMTSR